jgi:hypothetical protein
MKKIVVLFFISITIIGCQKTETITRDEVIAAIDKFDEGWRTKQPALVDSVLSPAYVYFTQSGGTFSRSNVVATAGSADYKLDSVNRRQFDILIDGNTATVNTIWYGRGTYYGKPFDDKQRCSVTLLKKDGKVKILAEHCTPLND